jgi:hypothetical protein
MRRQHLLAPVLLSIALAGSHARGGAIIVNPDRCPEPAGYLGFKDPQAVLDVGTETQAVAVADLDADGTRDIVAADTVGDRIRIRFGSGDGTFWGTHTWTMGDGPTDVAIGDFDGDGHRDIIATNFFEDRVRIRWGADSQSWAGFSSWATGDGPWRVAVGDLNGDGRDDFVTSNTLDNSLTVRRREADGGFDSQTYGAPEQVNDIQLADVDDDGDLDLVYPSGLHNAQIAVRLNDGSGVFGNPILSGMGSVYAENFLALTLGDYDEDGNLDVIASRNTHSLVRALGNGDGTFSWPVAAPTGQNPIHLISDDFNLDGDLDFAISHFSTELAISLYLGQGNGNVVGPVDLGVEFPLGKVFDLASGDFNQDGFPDIAYTDYEDALLMLSDYPCDRSPAPPCREAVGHLAFGDGQAVLDVGTEAQAVVAADLDGDGTQDVLATDTAGDRIRIRFGSGDGTFWGTHTWVMGDGPTDVAVGDFDGDGHRDIIATNYHEDRVRIRWGADSQSWAAFSSWATGDGPWRVAVGDINGDGRDDFVTTNVLGGNSLTVRRREADGGFDSQTYSAPEQANDLRLADVDDDGDLDLVYPSGLHNAQIAVRRNSGTGAFGEPLLSDMGSGFDDRFQAIAVGDYDEDGRLDIIAARNTHSLVRALGKGNGQFVSPVAAPVGNNPVHLVAADFDRDGHLDLAASHYANGGSLSLYVGQGNGNLTGPMDLGGTLPSSRDLDVAAGDFNGDGFPDLVCTDFGKAYLMLSDSPCDEEPPPPPPPAEVFRRGDSNGDGTVNIADAISTLACQFLGAACTTCPDAEDANDDGRRDLGDAVFTLIVLFQGTASLPPPGGEHCGRDPTRDDLPACEYDSCPALAQER